MVKLHVNVNIEQATRDEIESRGMGMSGFIEYANKRLKNLDELEKALVHVIAKKETEESKSSEVLQNLYAVLKKMEKEYRSEHINVDPETLTLRIYHTTSRQLCTAIFNKQGDETMRLLKHIDKLEEQAKKKAPQPPQEDNKVFVAPAPLVVQKQVSLSSK